MRNINIKQKGKSVTIKYTFDEGNYRNVNIWYLIKEHIAFRIILFMKTIRNSIHNSLWDQKLFPDYRLSEGKLILNKRANFYGDWERLLQIEAHANLHIRIVSRRYTENHTNTTAHAHALTHNLRLFSLLPFFVTKHTSVQREEQRNKKDGYTPTLLNKRKRFADLILGQLPKNKQVLLY